MEIYVNYSIYSLFLWFSNMALILALTHHHYSPTNACMYECVVVCLYECMHCVCFSSFYRCYSLTNKVYYILPVSQLQTQQVMIDFTK